MKLCFDALQIMDAIGRRGSFSAAAEELSRVPSTITYAVQKLEEDLGVPIFNRDGHRPRLTAAGEALLSEGRFILQAAADLEARVKRVCAGYDASLAIALDRLLPPAPLLDMAAQFYADEAYADTELCITHEMGASLDARAVRKPDLVLGAAPRNVSQHRKHHTRLIGTLESILAVSPRHPLARCPRPVATQAVRAHRVAIVAGTLLAEPLLEGRLAMRQRIIALPTLCAKIAAQKAGVAVGLVPRSAVARELQTGELVEVPLEHPAPRQNVYLAWDERRSGKAFQWWLERLGRPGLADGWLSRSASTAAFSSASFEQFEETFGKAR
jgi:DNA-binding transcriptional LysR family regulator